MPKAFLAPFFFWTKYRLLSDRKMLLSSKTLLLSVLHNSLRQGSRGSCSLARNRREEGKLWRTKLAKKIYFLSFIVIDKSILFT